MIGFDDEKGDNEKEIALVKVLPATLRSDCQRHEHSSPCGSGSVQSMRRAEEAQAEEPLTAEAEAEPEAEDDESDDDFACLAEAARGATDADPPSNPPS